MKNNKVLCILAIFLALILATSAFADITGTYEPDYAEAVLAFNAKTGHRLWTSGHALHGRPIFNAPSVVGGAVYAGAWDGRLHAFSPP